MAKQLPDGIASRQDNGGGVIGVLVAKGTGTTSGTTNTANLVTHGALDIDGNPFPAAKLFAFAIPSQATGTIYRSAAPTATQLDFRSVVTSVTYDWYLYVCN